MCTYLENVHLVTLSARRQSTPDFFQGGGEVVGGNDLATVHELKKLREITADAAKLSHALR
jgi:hypothetical protein